MNAADIKNIKLIIKSRKPIKFETDGDKSVPYLNSLSTEELQKMINEYESVQYNKAVIEFKSIISEIFEQYACSDENVIILSECFENNGLIDIRQRDFNCLNFTEVRKSTYNTIIQAPRWKYVDDLDMYDLAQKFMRLGRCLNSMKILKANNIFDSSEYGGEWHGYLAVNRNYEIISFVCREDNWLDGVPDLIKSL